MIFNCYSPPQSCFFFPLDQKYTAGESNRIEGEGR